MASRRHHYIPIFYLRQWVGADGKVCQFSRRNGRVVAKRKHPSATAYQDDLYSLEGMDEESAQWLEDVFFKVADQEGSDALQALLAGSTNMSAKHRSGWSRFLMSLMSRTPNKIAQLSALYADAMKDRYQALEAAYDEHHANAESPPSPEEKLADLKRSVELGRGSLMQSVMDLKNVGDHLNKMIWQVFILANGRRSLLTSDYPVFLSNGLQHDNSHLALPISPNKIFVAANDGKIIEQIAASVASDVTTNANRIVTRLANAYVYGTDDFQKNFVDKHLRAAD